ncbi:hypothetical protein Tco_1085375, partial [Tanacetum coccineum]
VIFDEEKLGSFIG